MTYWEAPTVLTSAREQKETCECRGLFHRACTLQSRTEDSLTNKLQRDRKSIPSQRPFTLFDTKPWCHSLLSALWGKVSAHISCLWDNQRITMQILGHISERITFPTVITAFNGECTSNILLSTLYILLYLFFFFFITMSVHTHTRTPRHNWQRVVKW